MDCNQSSLARENAAVDTPSEPGTIVPREDYLMEELLMKLKYLPHTAQYNILSFMRVDPESRKLIEAWHRRKLVEDAEGNYFIFMNDYERSMLGWLLFKRDSMRENSAKFGGFCAGNLEKFGENCAEKVGKWRNRCEEVMIQEQECIEKYMIEEQELHERAMSITGCKEPPMMGALADEGILPHDEVNPMADEGILSMAVRLEGLPDNVCLEILSFVPPETLVSFMGSNHRFRNLLLSQEARQFWIQCCGDDTALEKLTPEQHEEYRKVLKRAHESQKAFLVRVAAFALQTITTGAEEAIQNSLDQELQKAHSAFLRHVARSIVCQQRAAQHLDAGL